MPFNLSWFSSIRFDWCKFAYRSFNYFVLLQMHIHHSALKLRMIASVNLIICSSTIQYTKQMWYSTSVCGCCVWLCLLKCDTVANVYFVSHSFYIISNCCVCIESYYWHAHYEAAMRSVSVSIESSVQSNCIHIYSQLVCLIHVTHLHSYRLMIVK